MPWELMQGLCIYLRETMQVKHGPLRAHILAGCGDSKQLQQTAMILTELGKGYMEFK